MDESTLSLSASRLEGGWTEGEIRPYRIHVSSKYLDLTKRKLELTRLPHELPLPHSNTNSWILGTPKAEIEPLVDFWLEEYSWRAREAALNDGSLPQFRTVLTYPNYNEFGMEEESSVRMHFVHLKSGDADAVPLLLIPSFPLTSLSVPLEELLRPLTEMAMERGDDEQGKWNEKSFHVVVPSLPGLGFSDALTLLPDSCRAVALPHSSRNQRRVGGDGRSGSGYLKTTAFLLDQLMLKLGYTQYICTSTGSGYQSPAGIDHHIPTLLATNHSTSCVGIHLIDPLSTKPSLLKNPIAWLKYHIARLFKANIFGYTSLDWKALTHQTATARHRNRLHHSDISSENPSHFNQQRITRFSTSILGLSSASTNNILSLSQPNTLAYALCDSPVGLLSIVLSTLRKVRGNDKSQHISSPLLDRERIIDFTQLAWLPGPEAGMRFWGEAAVEARALDYDGKRKRGKVAVSVFLGSGGDSDDEDDDGDAEEYNPPIWTARDHDIIHTQRWHGRGGLIMWERPEVIVQGVRALASAVFGSDSAVVESSRLRASNFSRERGNNGVIEMREDFAEEQQENGRNGAGVESSSDGRLHGEDLELGLDVVMEEEDLNADDDADSPDTVVLGSVLR